MNPHTGTTNDQNDLDRTITAKTTKVHILAGVLKIIAHTHTHTHTRKPRNKLICVASGIFHRPKYDSEDEQ